MSKAGEIIQKEITIRLNMLNKIISRIIKERKTLIAILALEETIAQAATWLTNKETEIVVLLPANANKLDKDTYYEILTDTETINIYKRTDKPYPAWKKYELSLKEE